MSEDRPEHQRQSLPDTSQRGTASEEPENKSNPIEQASKRLVSQRHRRTRSSEQNQTITRQASYRKGF